MRFWRGLGAPKAHNIQVSPDHFGSHFPSKIDENIDAKIDAEKVRKIEEKLMRKQTYILMIFGIAFHENSSFSKKVHVRKAYDSCSRIGVREGSPKNKEIKKRGKSVKKLSKNRSRKKDATIKKKRRKSDPKRR